MVFSIKAFFLSLALFMGENEILQNTKSNSFGASQTQNFNQATSLLSQSTYAELIEHNVPKAQQLKKEACDLGLGRACWYYAYNTENEKDMQHAQTILTKDCFVKPNTISSGESCIYLGIMVSQRKAQAQKSEQELYAMGCHLNNGWGCYRLAKDFLANTNLNQASEMNTKAVQILTKECELDKIGSSCYLAGSVYEQPFSQDWIDEDTQYQKIHYFYAKGCELKDGDSCDALHAFEYEQE